MTQIIGAICDEHKKAIAVSDRMITTSDLSLSFEHEGSKIEKMATNCIALTAGSALIHAPIFRNVRATLKDKTRPLISEVVEEIVREYQNLRVKRMEDQIFRCESLTIQQFYEKQRELHDAVVMRLTDAMRKYRLDLYILVIGVDTEGAHLYRIDDPGVSTPFNALGFSCIGTGERHADSTFAYRRYSPSIPLKKALFIAYEAKKRAEMAGGVGKTTDIAIIDEKEIKILPQTVIMELEKIYGLMEEKRVPYGDEINTAIEGLRLE